MEAMDRTQAGKALVNALAIGSEAPPPVVLALAPGAVPIAYEVARAAHAELDLLEVAPFYAPGTNLELGEVASGGMRVLHAERGRGLLDADIAAAAAPVADAIAAREHAWRRHHPRPDLAGVSVVLVADTVGADARMDAAVLLARVMGASRVVAAAPVALRKSLPQLRDDADAVIYLDVVDDARALDLWYQGEPPEDSALLGWLRRAEEWRALA